MQSGRTRCALHATTAILHTMIEANKSLRSKRFIHSQRILECTSILFHPLFNKHHTTQHSLNASHHTAFYFDSDTQMLPAIITTTTTDRSIAFLFPVISLYSVIPQMLDTIVGPQQMIGNEIVSPVYAFA